MGGTVATVSADEYLRAILEREAVDIGMRSPLRGYERDVSAACRELGIKLLEIYPTGGFEKGTANASSVSIDFLASFAPTATETTHEIYEALFETLRTRRLEPVKRDVSIALLLDGIAIDIVPGKREAMISDMHEIWIPRLERSVKTNLTQHILDAIGSGRREEVRIMKIWRDQQGLDFPSFYLELSINAALRRQPQGALAANVWAVLGYLETFFPARSILDPVNANNIVSDQLTSADKDAIRKAAQYARAGRAWSEIIR
jgi:hypothetical protein